ncbi:MAG TPA: OmpA family protein [Polyangiaceae bacterium]|jgi:outer membrane protein OmpA-like peptidoglycan-associated protein
MTKTNRYVAALGALALLSATEAQAHAQTPGFAVDRFEPSERGSDWFALDSLDLRGHVRPALGLVAEYSYRPLVIYNSDDSVRESIVRNSLVLHPGGSLVLWDRLRVGFDLPVYAYQFGHTGTLAGTTYQPPSEGVGDLRLGADARIYGKYDDAFTLAGGVQLFVPTGSRADYTSDGVTRAEPRVLAAGRVGAFVYAGKLAFDYRALRDSFAGSSLGSDFLFAASAGVKTWQDRLVVGPEIFGSTVVTGHDGAFTKDNTPFEMLFAGHVTVADDWRFGGGIGPGLTRAFGEPVVRAVISAEWAPAYAKPRPPPPPPAPPPTPPPPPPPPPPEPPPPPPPDRDGDGIVDAEDACPDVPGVRTDDPKTNGCPPDRDKDGILDPQDACPDVPGPPNEDPKKNGCPLAQIVEGQVKIRDQIKFRFDKADLDPASDPILEAVAAILTAHPEIARVRVEGHTDNQGSAAYNLSLSKRRAASVLKWLGGHGIAKGRLQSEGYGLTRPIDDNATEDGRRNNRRVEFHIVEAKSPASAK